MFRRVSRNRSILLLALILLASFLWMTSQARKPQRAGLAERAANAISYPFVRAIGATAGAAKGVWQSYFYLVGLRGENRRLALENGRLSMENARLRQDVYRERRLEDLWALREDDGFNGTAAAVIGRDASTWFKTVWINKGESDGVARNMPAALYTGIVGKVIKTYGGTSRVLLITDPASAVSCVDERSREPGILVGEGGGSCRLLYIGKHADVKPGDLIVTSGLDAVFPQGMPIGEVTKISGSAPGFFMDIGVKPTAEINSLEELFLIDYTPPAIPKEEAAPVQGAKK